MFDEYRIEGKDDRNEIYLEINLDQLNRALKSTLNAHAVKIKLTKKQGACLTIDITQVRIVNWIWAGGGGGQHSSLPVHNNNMGVCLQKILVQFQA